MAQTAITPTTNAIDRKHPRHGHRRRGSPRSGWLLAIVLTGQFMALLDASIVNVAAPTIGTDLRASGAGLQLVIAGYTIAYAVLLITGARLGDLLGHRRMFLSGLAVFTAASLACGLAGGTGELIAFRLVQGAGSALMLPQVLSLIQRTFTGLARVRALNMFSAVLASGYALGQVLGGVLVSADLFGSGWRPVFLVNVPIGAVLLLAGPRLMPRDGQRDQERRRGLDLPGLVTLSAAVTLFTVPLVLGQQEGWPVWCWVCLALSGALLAVFAGLESRLARRGGAPLISARVFRAPGLRTAVVQIGLVMALNAGLMFSFALHLQSGLGHDALHAGMVFAPAAVAFGAVGLNWRRIPQRWHAALVPSGFFIAGSACVLCGLLLRDGGSGGAWLYPAMAAAGLGVGLAYSPNLTRALGSVAARDAADASGLLVTVTQLGQLVGVATLGTLYLNRVSYYARSGSAGTHASALGVWVTAVALAGTALLGALAGVSRRR
ncbi:MFS transporter [Streptomyces sp. NPDC020096]